MGTQRNVKHLILCIRRIGLGVILFKRYAMRYKGRNIQIDWSAGSNRWQAEKQIIVRPQHKAKENRSTTNVEERQRDKNARTELTRLARQKKFNEFGGKCAAETMRRI